MADPERLEELYKHFRSAQNIIDIDIENSDAYKSDHARLSQDPVLNALAQLGVCRLGCERAFVSLIDDRNQYVVAEVSKSISLYNADHHPDDQGIAVGVRALDLVSGVCAGTMPAFTCRNSVHHISTENITANSKSFVIKDFTLEPEYRARPYVVAFPFMRFYAGVPIRSNSGHVIGTYAVIDSQPRNGLDDQSLLVLTEIASSVMRHLELLKIQTSHDSALSLLEGLKLFVEGSNSTAGTAVAKIHIQEPLLPDQTEQVDRHELGNAGREPSAEPRHELPKISTAEEDHVGHDSDELQMERLKSSTPISQPVVPETPEMVGAPPTKLEEGTHASPAGKYETPRKTEHPAGMRQYDSLLSRASASIRAAMRMDEVFFIDAPSSTASFTGSNIPVKISASVPAIEGSRSLTISQEGAGSRHGRSHDHPSRPHQPDPNLHITSDGHVEANDEYRISEELHTELLWQYPAGCFLNFINGEIENYPGFTSREVYTHTHSADYQRSNIETGHEGQNHRGVLNYALHSALPLANSIIFLPLFGSDNRDCPFSIVAWSSESRRIIQQEDFSYLGLFGVAIQAEFARIISSIQNRAKSDFISSISHELRSPLHGILGNVELLLDSDVEQEQRQMAETIEKCGRSLLSTMDHILTYSKINSSTKEGRSPNHGTTNEGSVPTSIDLSAVVEDSVDTLMAGNHFRALSSMLDTSGGSQSRIMSHERPLDPAHSQQVQGPLVNLMIDHCSSWYVVTDGPVWTRCVINILGNALKYTESGIIEVKLHLTPPTASEAGESRTTARLSISDTGRGISSAYLRSHLYQPFLQENASSNGLGLGLSIVKKMIDGLEGSVNVQSTVGQGTLVEVSVPVRVERRTADESHVNLQHSGRKICFVGKTHKRASEPARDSFLPSRENRGAALSSALSLYCSEWFDMKVSYAETLEDATGDVIAIFEEDLGPLQHSNFSGQDKDNQRLSRAFIVIPASTATTKRPSSTKTDGTFYLTSPFGPRRLAITMKQALGYTDKIKAGTLIASADPVNDQALVSTTNNKEAGLTKPIVVVGAHKTFIKRQRPSMQAGVFVLAVEDNDVNLKLLEKCLQRWGIAYKTASDGAQAVEVFQQSEKAFDYILMDISMPVMNGIESTRAIRKLEAAWQSRRRARIVAMTGLGDERTRQEALASGMDVFLTKPIRLGEVKKLLQGS